MQFNPYFLPEDKVKNIFYNIEEWFVIDYIFCDEVDCNAMHIAERKHTENVINAFNDANDEVKNALKKLLLDGYPTTVLREEIKYFEELLNLLDEEKLILEIRYGFQ